ncbi:hypothetical protein D5086_022673 [Populus alba]|uniref:Uncharacterized protein n=1 Tax=Populus alba TaxID=43335 RepID=A0ACC4BGB7_POPAL
MNWMDPPCLHRKFNLSALTSFKSKLGYDERNYMHVIQQRSKIRIDKRKSSTCDFVPSIKSKLEARTDLPCERGFEKSDLRCWKVSPE